MRRAFSFAKRNLLELKRDVVAYVFCVLLPLAMLVMFCVINSFTQEQAAVFSLSSLVPGMIVFSFSFITLQASLTATGDKTSGLLFRLFASPMRGWEFLFGYAFPLFLVGILQEICCILGGFLLSCIVGGGYFSFAQALLLCVQMLPILLIFLFLGLGVGFAFNERTAPGFSSIFISASGVLSGAWMPLETMGGFETFCSFLPFWQSVKTGRAITGAYDSFGQIFTFEGIFSYFLVTAIFLAFCIFLALFLFARKRRVK